MRKITTILLLFWGLQTFAIDMDWRISTRAGWIINDGKVEDVAPKRLPAIGGEVAVGFHPKWNCLEQWNRSSVGAALSYWYLGDDRLGHALAPYTFMDIPLLRRKHIVLGLRPGIGFALVTKTFGNTYHGTADELQNFSLKGSGTTYTIGSVFNFYFPEAFYMDFPIKHGWTITLAGGWYHISNGSMVQPNSGYNTFSAEIGIRNSPDPATNGEIKEEADLYGKVRDMREKKKWTVEASVTGGFRQVYYKDQQTFGCATMEVSAFWRAHNIFRLGGGVDVFFDGAYREHETKFSKTDLRGATLKDCWRVGLSIQPEFVVGNFIAGFHAGAYMYDPVKKMEGNGDKGIFYAYDILNAGSAAHPDGWLYTAIVLKYHLPYHLMVQAEMKAHVTKVEFVSIGIGGWL